MRAGLARALRIASLGVVIYAIGQGVIEMVGPTLALAGLLTAIGIGAIGAIGVLVVMLGNAGRG